MANRMTLIISVLLLHQSTCTSPAFQNRHYFPVNSTNIKMDTLRSGWTNKDLVFCSLSCSEIRNCSSFIYNSTSGVCIPGAGIGHSRDSVPFQGKLYVSGECDTKDGFTLHVNGSTKACLRLSSDKLNFANANASCTAKGGYLTTPKTPEKIATMFSIARAQREFFWLGLDDREVENVFRWHDDGSVLTAEQHQKLFSPGQPDDPSNNEDCVEYHRIFETASDYDCQDELSYLCELPIPSRLH